MVVPVAGGIDLQGRLWAGVHADAAARAQPSRARVLVDGGPGQQACQEISDAHGSQPFDFHPRVELAGPATNRVAGTTPTGEDVVGEQVVDGHPDVA